MYEAPDRGMPHILNFYQVASMVSTLAFMATNSAPKTETSMVDYFLEHQLINDMFIEIMKPVLDILVGL